MGSPNKYLYLQFWNRIYEKSGVEFQSFFEKIMKKSFPDFQKIRPYGNEGDRGNDGYRPSEGIYYQVYSPIDPHEKEAKTAKKLKEDFEKLKNNWDKIAKIKQYYFVFNDKNRGVSIKIEDALADLRSENPTIQFDRLLSQDLEEIFFSLDKEQQSLLDFDIDVENDSSKVINFTKQLISKVHSEIGKGNVDLASNILETLKKDIYTLENEELLLDFEILVCRAMDKLEKRKEAKQKYRILCDKYPKDPRAFLYLAEIFLDEENFEENEKLLNKAELIDPHYWLLKLEKLIRVYRSGEDIDLETFVDAPLPYKANECSSFYGVYALFFEKAGNYEKADNYLEKAINSSPERFNNYFIEVSILMNRALQNTNRANCLEETKNVLLRIKNIEEMFKDWGVNLTSRNKAILNNKKIRLLLIVQGFQCDSKILINTLHLLLDCYFDPIVEELFIELLLPICLSDEYFQMLLGYLSKVDNVFSDSLSKVIIVQFIHHKTLFTEGVHFFEQTGKKRVTSFIKNLKNSRYKRALSFVDEDLQFAKLLASYAKDLPTLRKKIIEKLPNDVHGQREKLHFLLHYDEKNTDEAFGILQKIDLAKVSCLELKPMLEIAEEKKAWDFVVKISEKILEYEVKESVLWHLKLKMCSANFHLQKLLEVIKIGKEILDADKEIDFLSVKNKEVVLAQLLISKAQRGEYLEAKKVLEKYQDYATSFEFKIGIEAEIYLKTKFPKKALKSVVSGICNLKVPTPEQYGRLFLFSSQLSALMKFSLNSLTEVKDGVFVKLQSQVRWYFIGDGSELDATKIMPKSERYLLFLSKKKGDKINFESKYSSQKEEHVIENILSLEKYILWSCRYHVEKLSAEGRWNAIEMIEVPKKGEKIDLKYLIARMEDIEKSNKDIFDLYCKGNIPLAFLALKKGGVAEAIGYILNRGKGFIHSTTGKLADLNEQKIVAERIIDGDVFFIDATSVLMLSEFGILEKVVRWLPNLKVPQSAINMLLKIKEKFNYSPGQKGTMDYVEGQIVFSEINEQRSAKVQENIRNSLEILESNVDNIIAISKANKVDCFSEKEMLGESCDACILAQQEETFILTEDFIYLKCNELETGKKAPRYCSSIILVRVLYEQGKIPFKDYLSYFSYLASYRFRFLYLNPKDILKAVLGDSQVIRVSPEKIRLLNLQLILSEEYGVSYADAFNLVGCFIYEILLDDSLTLEITGKIFTEIIESFPTTEDKKTLAEKIINTCIRSFNQRKIILPLNMINRKINYLSILAKSFHSDIEIIYNSTFSI